MDNGERNYEKSFSLLSLASLPQENGITATIADFALQSELQKIYC